MQAKQYSHCPTRLLKFAAVLVFFAIPLSLSPALSIRTNPTRSLQSSRLDTSTCVSLFSRALVGKAPPRVDVLQDDAVTTRLILFAPDSSEEPPTLDELASWLRPGYYTLLVEHPDRLWNPAYMSQVSALAHPDAVSAAIANKVGHKYEPATFAVLPAAHQGCLASRGMAGVLFAQVHDVESILYVRHFAERRLEDWFPRYFLPHQRLPVLNVSALSPWFAEGIRAPEDSSVETEASELTAQHFERDSRKGGAAFSRDPDSLHLCTQPTRPVLQYGLCQSRYGTPDTFLLEEVPPVVVRPVHPALGHGPRALPRNVFAYRPAFWALALLALAEQHASHDPDAALALERGVLCSLARLQYDVATLPPGALCGDPPAERDLAVYDPPVSVPDHDHGLQVNYERLTAHPFFGFNPSRAHGPLPFVPVPVDAVPTMDRNHMFRSHSRSDGSLNVSAVTEILEGCLPAIPSPGSDWIAAAVPAVLQDFADVGTRIALPTSAQLDGRCLKNCFQSSHLTRDISISQVCVCVLGLAAFHAS
jgi:hypothetical protein